MMCTDEGGYDALKCGSLNAGTLLSINHPDFAKPGPVLREQIERITTVSVSKRRKYSPTKAADAVESFLAQVAAAAAAKNAKIKKGLCF
jgi:hypothetical protein